MSATTQVTSTQMERGKEEQFDQKHDVRVYEDDAAKALEGQDVFYTADEERQLIRKTDLITVPLMAMGCGILCVDKNVLSSAAALTLLEDLELQGSQYSWAVSIYYFGLLVGTYPFNLITQKYHSGRVVGIAFILWGISIFATMAVKDYRGLFACRFILGIFEAAAVPAFTLTTTRLYTAAEQPARFTFWGAGNTFFPVFFILIYYALGRVPDHPLEPWRWFYCLLGGITVIFGITYLLVFPDRPDNCWWYSKRQKAVAVARIARQQNGVKNHHFKSNQLKEALLDYKVWMCGFMFAFQTPAPGIAANFLSLIIKGYGFTGLTSIVLQIPTYALPTILAPIVGWILSRNKTVQGTKSLACASLSAIALICQIVLYTHPPVPGANRVLPLFFVHLMSVNLVNWPLVLNMCGSNFSGTTKKQTAVAITYMFYCISNIASPQAFLARQAPRYKDGIIWVKSAQTGLTLFSLAFFFLCRMENKRREAAAVQSGTSTETVTEEELISWGLADMTDKENTRFRYCP